MGQETRGPAPDCTVQVGPDYPATMRVAAIAAVVVAVVLAGCKKAGRELPGLLPPVRSFLQKNDHGFGRAILAGDNLPWAKGPRQWVSFDTGRSLLFYVEADKVVTVYEQDSAGRRKVWGEYSSPP